MGQCHLGLEPCKPYAMWTFSLPKVSWLQNSGIVMKSSLVEPLIQEP